MRTFRARLFRTRLLRAPLLSTRLFHACSFIFVLTLHRPLARFLLAHRPLRLRGLLAMNHLA